MIKHKGQGFRNNDIEVNRSVVQQDANRTDIFSRRQKQSSLESQDEDGAHKDTEAPSDARPGADKQR